MIQLRLFLANFILITSTILLNSDTSEAAEIICRYDTSQCSIEREKWGIHTSCTHFLLDEDSLKDCSTAKLCADFPCNYGGTCHEGRTTYSCECGPLFSGDRCTVSDFGFDISVLDGRHDGQIQDFAIVFRNKSMDFFFKSVRLYRNYGMSTTQYGILPLKMTWTQQLTDAEVDKPEEVALVCSFTGVFEVGRNTVELIINFGSLTYSKRRHFFSKGPKSNGCLESIKIDNVLPLSIEPFIVYTTDITGGMNITGSANKWECGYYRTYRITWTVFKSNKPADDLCLLDVDFSHVIATRTCFGRHFLYIYSCPVVGVLMPPQNYRVCIDVKIKDKYFKQMEILKCGYVKIIDRPNLEAVVKPAEIDISWLKTSPLTIDASDSINHITGDKVGLSYQWNCQTESLFFECFFKHTIYGEDKFQPGLNFSAITIPAINFVPDDVYVVSVNVSKEGMPSNVKEVKIHPFVPWGQPYYYIRCLTGCTKRKIKTEMDAVFKLDCSDKHGECTEITLKYMNLEGRTTKMLAYLFYMVENHVVGLRTSNLIPGEIYYLNFTGPDSHNINRSVVRLLHVNTVPTVGLCSVSPLSGMAQVTKYTITCCNFTDEDQPLQYWFTLENRTVFGIMIDDKIIFDTWLPEGYINDNYYHNVSVFVMDSEKSFISVEVPVQALPVQEDENGTVALNILGQIESLISSSQNDNEIRKDKTRLVTVLNVNLDNDDATGIKGKIREMLIEEISLSSATIPGNLTEMDKDVDFLNLLVEKPEEITQSAEDMARASFINLSGNLVDLGKTSVDSAKDIAWKLLHGTSKLMSGFISRGHDYLSTINITELHDNVSQIVDGVEKERNNTSEFIKIFDTIGEAMFDVVQPDEPPIIIQTSKLSLTVGRFSRALTNITQSFGSSGSFSIPDLLSSDINTSPEDIPVGFQVGEYEENPYLWNPTAKSIDASVCSIILKNSNGTDLIYNNLSVPFDVEIVTKRTPSFGNTDFEISLTVTFDLLTYEILDSDSKLIIIPITPKKTVMAVIKPINTSLTIHILPFYDKRNVTLQDIMEDGFTVPIRESKLQMYKHYKQDPHIVFFPEVGDMELDEFYIAVGVTLHQILDKELVESSEIDLNVHVHVEIFNSHCAFWDTRIEEWSQEGCQLTNLSTVEVLHCQCDHLTSFSGGMLITPNILNPIGDARLFLTFFDNPVVVFAVIMVWVLYLFLLCWARTEDKKDYRKRGVTVLEDNDCDNHYIYLVGVLTGWWRGAGTSADVFVYLRSKCNQSSRHALLDSERQQFMSGSEDWFLLTTPARLGKLKSVIIWHNNSGKSPSWYLKEVIIKDVQTGESWHCIYNNWLSVDRGPKELRAEIPAIVEGDMQNQNLYQFSLKSSQDFRDGHLWISIFSKPLGSNFTRTQRLTCALSLLITCMLTNLMFLGVPDTIDPQAQLFQHTFQLNLTDIIIGIETALLMFPINFTIIQLFIRISPKPHQSKDPQSVEYYKNCKKENEKKQSTGFKLPWWFLYISWTIAILSSLISSYFVMLYGLKYGYATSLSWLITFFTSFSQSAFITQPFKVLLIAFIVTLIFKRPASYQPTLPDEELDDNEEYLQKRIIEKQITWQARRQEQQHYYIPPISKNSIKNIQQRLKIDKIIKEAWRDIFMYIVFVVIVLLTVHGHSHVNPSFLFSNVNKNMFIDAKYTDTLPFDEITTFDKFWEYTETLLNNMRQSISSSTIDGTSYLLGKARLRQIRQQKNKCDFSYFNKFGLNNLYCTGSYWMGNDDTGFYNKSWQKEIEEPSSPYDTAEWFYQSSWKLKTLPYIGHHAAYPGSGFVLEMSLDKLEAMLKFSEMKNTQWIDDRTRAVFIEFTLYNPNVNQFSVMILLVEFTNYNGVFASHQIFTTNLYHYADDFEVFVAVCECIFILFIVSFTYFEIKKISKDYKGYFDDVWSYVEVSILALSYSAISIFTFRILTVNSVLQEYKDSNGGKFISFYTAISWDYILQYILACLATLVIVKFFKILNFSKNMSFLAGTLQKGKLMIRGITLIIVFATIAFGHFSYLVFGSQLKGYSNILNTVNTLLNFILGISDYFGIVSVNSILGSLFFFIFSVFFQYVLVTMFLAIIMTAFTTLRNEQRLQVNDDELHMMKYLYTKIKLMIDQ